VRYPVNQFYSLADILVLPTITEDEGFGIVLLEAMANGIPVVGSNIGGIPEVIVDGETGFLFEPSNYLDLAEKINILLNNKLLRQKMGQKGQELVKTQFSWTKIASQVKEIYLGSNE
jgi:glycosyltransferase involved in cell wall biosynthesis